MLCESLHKLHDNLNDKNTRARAVDLLKILARWLRMGGFPPTLEKETYGTSGTA
jgi:hypothetical protein